MGESQREQVADGAEDLQPVIRSITAGDAWMAISDAEIVEGMSSSDAGEEVLEADCTESGVNGEWPSNWAERKGVPKYSNELDRLFWESPDPFANLRELRRQMEEGG